MTQTPATPLPSPAERRRLREALNLSRPHLAARLRVSTSCLRRWENGHRDPEGEQLASYARELGLTEQSPGAGDAEASASRAEEVEGEGSTTGTSETGTQAESGAEPETEAETEIGARHETRAETETGAKPETEPETRAKPETRAEPEASAKAEPTAAPEPTPESEANTAPATEAEAEPTTTPPTPQLPTPTTDFDTLYTRTAPALIRQTYLLTAHRRLAAEAVEQAFQHAWRNWPKVATDPDPVAWVRAAAHEYATSPWHQYRPGRNDKGPSLTHRQNRELLGVLVELPVTYCRTLLLHDLLGLSSAQTAAETESSTTAAENRLDRARELIGARLPELREVARLRERLARLAEESAAEVPAAARMRELSERRTRQWTRAALGLTAAVVTATVLTLATAPTQYEPPIPHGRPVGGVPPQLGPEPAPEGQRAGQAHRKHRERDDLRDHLTRGPDSRPERLRPETG